MNSSSTAGEVEEALRKPVEPAKHVDRLAAFFTGRDEIAFGAITLGDVIYDRISIDPAVLQAFDFAHAPNAGDVHELATWSHRIVDGSPLSYEGNVARLQGYVFERMAAVALHESGAVVEFPDSPTQPGWDFLVNGEPVQAKCGISPELVTEHLKSYPDIPRVVVNEDLATHFVDNENVIAIHGLTRDTVTATTEHSLDAAADMLDLHIGSLVPAISVYRNARALWRQETDWRGFTQNVAADAGGRFAGAGAGKLIGGLLAVGIGGWAGILLPVATTVVGYRGGRLLSDHFKRKFLLKNEYTALESAIAAWSRRAAEVLSVMQERSRRRWDRIAAACADAVSPYEPLVSDWERRAKSEQSIREFHYNQFLRGAQDPLIFGARDGIVASAAEAMFEASRAGLFPADLQAQRPALTEALSNYVAGLRHFASKP